MRRTAPFDLILANILADPLIELAPALRRHLAPGGHAVLSGLLDRQAERVIAAHRDQGLRLVQRFDQGPWTALVLRAPGRRVSGLTVTPLLRVVPALAISRRLSSRCGARLASIWSFPDMPKMKTKRSAAKRFSLTGTGKVKRADAYHRHMMTDKPKRAKVEPAQAALSGACRRRAGQADAALRLIAGDEKTEDRSRWHGSSAA